MDADQVTPNISKGALNRCHVILELGVFCDTSPLSFHTHSLYELVIVPWSDSECYCLSAGAPVSSGTGRTRWTWTQVPSSYTLTHHLLTKFGDNGTFLILTKSTFLGRRPNDPRGLYIMDPKQGKKYQ